MSSAPRCARRAALLALGLAVAASARADTLDLVGVVENGVDGVVGLPARQIALSPDGNHLYVANGFGVVVFARDPGTGLLTWLQALCDDESPSCPPSPAIIVSEGTIHVVVAPDGAHVYSYAGLDAAISKFIRDPGTGLLTFAGSEPGLADHGELIVSGDGLTVYSAQKSGDIAAFDRNPGNGDLSFLASYPGGGPGLTAERWRVSADGAHVYGWDHGWIGVWNRDGGTGALSFAGMLCDEDNLGGSPCPAVPGVDGLSIPGRRFELSSDGEHLYTVGAEGLGTFDRDPATGMLSFVDLLANPPGLASLAVDPTGTLVYAPLFDSKRGDRLIPFLRDSVDGHLERASGDVQISADRPAVSPDGAHLYAAGTPEVLLIFALDPAAATVPYLIPALSPPWLLGLGALLALGLLVALRRVPWR